MSKLNPVYYVVVFILATLFYTYLSYKVGANSDNMSSLLIAKDIADGNYRLSGWWMSTQSYIFSDIVWTSLIIKLFGYSPSFAHIIPSIFYVINCFVAIALVYSINKKSLYIITPLIIVPTFFTIAVSAELNIHGGIYTFSSLLLFIFYKKDISISYVMIFILSMLCGAFADSDKLIIFTFILPIFIAAIFHSIKSKNTNFLRFSVFSILSIIFYKVFGVINGSFFAYITPGVGTQGIASFNDIITHINILITGMYWYFGIHPNDGYEPVSIFRIVCLILFITCYIYSIVKRWNKSFIDMALFFISCIPVAAFIFSTVAIATDLMATRYIFYSFFAASILIGRSINIAPFERWAIPFLVVWATTNLATFNMQKESTDSYFQRLGAYLTSEGLEKGYSEFWKASMLSAVSDVHLSPVKVEQLIIPMYWLSKSSWYQNGGNFFITNDKGEAALAVSQFGEPIKILEFEGMNILVWDKILLQPTGFKIHKIYKNMLPTQVGDYIDGSIYSTNKKGFLIYGPYISLNKGNYTLTVNGNGAKAGDVIDVSDNSQSAIIFESNLKFDNQGRFIADIFVPDNYNSIEVRVRTEGNSNLVLTGYSVIRK